LLFIGILTKDTFCVLLPGTKEGIEVIKRNSPNNRAVYMVRVTGVEPARIAPPEPNGNVTLLELMFCTYFKTIEAYD